MTSSRGLLAAGLVLLVAAALWRPFVAPRWTDRLPPGWRMELQFQGVQTNADSTGRLPEQDALARYERVQRIVADPGGGMVQIEDRYTVIDFKTRRPSFEYVREYPVFRRTGAHATPALRGQIAVFPRRTQKTTYRYTSSYAKAVPVRYAGEEAVHGLSTYLFAFKGRGEYTESYAGTPEYPGVSVAPGQEIRCADDQFYLRLWVEPMTGWIVKIEEGCPSGDFVYDIATGRAVAAVDRWSGSSAGTSLVRRVAAVRQARSTYLRAAVHVPVTMALAGVALLLAGWRGRRRARAIP